MRLKKFLLVAFPLAALIIGGSVISVAVGASSTGGNSLASHSSHLSSGGMSPGRIAESEAREEALGRPLASKSPPTSLPDAGQGIMRTGVIATTEGPFPPGEFVVSNAWIGSVDSVQYYVYAGMTGVDASAPSEPGIVVCSEPIEDVSTGTDLQLVGTFLEPLATSALQVVGASGTSVSLTTTADSSTTTADGQGYSFDLSNDTFS